MKHPLSIVIPVYHEEKNILKLFKDIEKKVSTDKELLLIYDQNDDPTKPVVEKYINSKHSKNIFLIKNFSGNKKGVINAIKTGFKESSGDAVLVVMADLSDDLKIVDKMYKKIEDGYDIVCGSRYMPGGKKVGGPFLKTLLSKAAGLSLHYLFRLPTRDATNAFKMYKKGVLKKIQIESKGGFEYSLEIITKGQELDYKITEIPSTWLDRQSGKSNFRLRKWLPSYIKLYLRAASYPFRKIHFPVNLYYSSILAFLLLIQINSIGLKIKEKILISSSIDFSWMTDFIERQLHGFIAGKDFIFTYGPLFQFIYSLPSLIFRMPSYLAVAYSPLISSIIIFFILLFISKLITKKTNEQLFLFTLILVVASVLTPPNFDLIKALVPILFSLLWFRYIWNKSSFIRTLVFVPILPTIFGAFSYDLFLYSLIIGLSLAIVKQFLNKRTFSIHYFTPVLLIFLYQLLFSFFLSGGINYILYSIDTSRSFMQTLNGKWSFDRNIVLAVFPLILVILIIYSLFGKMKILKNNLGIFLLIAFSSLLQLQTAFVRSDAGHITRSLYPSIISTFIVMYFIAQNKLKLIFLTLFIFITFIFAMSLSFGNIKTAIQTVVNKPTFLTVYKLNSKYQLGLNEINYLSEFISAHKGKVFIYPYDNYLLDINKDTFNSFPLQFYQYSGSLGEITGVNKLDKNPPQFVIFGVDGKGVIDLDQTPNLTRNSKLFSWLINHYITIKTDEKYLILKYVENKAITQATHACSLIGFRVKSENRFYSLLDKIIGIIKPQIFYLSYGNSLIRLPKVDTRIEYYIFKDYTNGMKLKTLFDKNPVFAKYYNKDVNKENLRIIKYAFFGLVKTNFKLSNEDAEIKCYD